MTDTQVTKKEEQSPARTRASEPELIFVPDVDIAENESRILLAANMPGIDQDTVEVTVKNGVLTIEGRARIEGPDGYQLIGEEYRVGRYRRDFTLSNAVDTDGIKAKVRDGVLSLTVPKRDEAKTRKVAIES